MEINGVLFDKNDGEIRKSNVCIYIVYAHKKVLILQVPFERRKLHGVCAVLAVSNALLT